MPSQIRAAQTIVSAGNWINFTTANLAANDGTYAYNNVTAYTAGVLRNFGFSIPTGATITGLIVDAAFGSSAGNATAYSRVRFSKDAGGNWTAYSQELSSNSPSGDDEYFGTASDLWGTSWTPEQINDNANFFLAVEGRISATNREIRYDHIEVEFHYEEAGGNELIQTPADNVSVTDNAILELSINKTFVDSVTVTDEHFKQATSELFFDDSAFISDHFTKQLNDAPGALYVRFKQNGVWAYGMMKIYSTEWRTADLKLFQP